MTEAARGTSDQIGRVAESAPRGFAEWRGRQVTVGSADQQRPSRRDRRMDHRRVLRRTCPARSRTPAGVHSGRDGRGASPAGRCDLRRPCRSNERATAACRAGHSRSHSSAPRRHIARAALSGFPRWRSGARRRPSGWRAPARRDGLADHGARRGPWPQTCEHRVTAEAAPGRAARGARSHAVRATIVQCFRPLPAEGDLPGDDSESSRRDGRSPVRTDH